MRNPSPYYVRRLECWGGSYVFCVADNRTRKQVTPTFKLRATVEKKVETMNRDFGRYQDAMWSKRA